MVVEGGSGGGCWCWSCGGGAGLVVLMEVVEGH